MGIALRKFVLREEVVDFLRRGDRILNELIAKVEAGTASAEDVRKQLDRINNDWLVPIWHQMQGAQFKED